MCLLYDANIFLTLSGSTQTCLAKLEQQQTLNAVTGRYKWCQPFENKAWCFDRKPNLNVYNEFNRKNFCWDPLTVLLSKKHVSVVKLTSGVLCP